MRRVALAMVAGVLAGSGGYALVYLFRWEWHRAIITALFFVAAEVGLGIAVVLRRLGRLEQQLLDLADRPALASAEIDPAILARLRATAPPTPTPFKWLDPRGPNLSVFLPFLLGLGALASGLAWVVEHLARHTTTPALERRLAHRLTPLALPAGGLLGPDPAPLGAEPIGEATRQHSAVVQPRGGKTATYPRTSSWPERPVAVRGWMLPLVAVVLVVGVAMAGIDWLGDALQTRPDARQEHVSTRIDVELRGARSAAWPDQAAATLWGTCSHVLHGTVGPAVIRDLGSGRFELLVPTHIGHHAEERVRGCLEDAVVDRVQATVRAVEVVPAG